MVHNDTFFLILNHTNISIGITRNIERKSAFSDTILRCPNLADSSMELCMQQSPQTGTALKHEDGSVFLDVPTPGNGRRYIHRNPTGADESLIATPE